MRALEHAVADNEYIGEFCAERVLFGAEMRVMPEEKLKQIVGGKMRSSFGIQLSAALRERKMSRSELARRIKVSRAVVTDYCYGRHRPRLEVLDRINATLGTKLSLTRGLKIDDVAKALNIHVDTLRRGIRCGALADIGAAIPSPSGSRCRYVLYEQVIAEKLGV